MTADINVIADNRNSLIGFIMQHLLENKSIIEYDYIFAIERNDCGCRRVYEKFDDIPDKNVICKHGNKMIIYSQLN